MSDYASKGLSGTALGLAIPDTVALANQLFQGGGFPFLGGPNPMPMMQKEILDLKTENTGLKANQFTLEQIQPMQIQIAQQGEQIACLSKQMELNNQIIDGKIAQVACTANSGISVLQTALSNLQDTVNAIIQPFVPNTKVVTPATA